MSYANLVKTYRKAHARVFRRTQKNLSLAEKVDRMGVLRAEIADLESELEKLKEDLRSSGLSEISGELFRVKVSRWSQAEVDWRAVVSDLKVPQHVLNNYTTTSERSRVTVTARS